MNQEIENKLKGQKNQKVNNQQPISLTTKLFIGGGIVVLLIISALVILRLKRRKIRLKKKISL